MDLAESAWSISCSNSTESPALVLSIRPLSVSSFRTIRCSGDTRICLVTPITSKSSTSFPYFSL